VNDTRLLLRVVDSCKISFPEGDFDSE
jgi:hypothetical protein